MYAQLKDRATSAHIISAIRTGNNRYPIYAFELGRANVATEDTSSSMLWHRQL